MMDYYFLLCFTACSLSVAESCTYCEQDVYKHLFQQGNYSKEIRPVYTQSDVVNVNVSMTVTSLLGINEKAERMDIMGFFGLIWTDIRLTWNPADFGNVEQIVIPASEIWLPDVIISNSATSFYEYTYKRDFMVYIFNDGYVSWEFGGVISTNCDINMREYPFDTQNCSVEMETWKYIITELNLHLEDTGAFIIKDGAKTNSLWEFNEEQAKRTLIYNNNYSRLIFTLLWKRRQLYYYFNLLIPAIMMIWAALGVFWLPVESGEKVSLAVTLLLAFSVFLIIIMDNTPVNSREIPLITSFVILLMGVTTLALCLAILLSYLNGKTVQTPRWLRIICFKYLAKGMWMDIDSTIDYVIEHDGHSQLEGGINFKTKPRKSQVSPGIVPDSPRTSQESDSKLPDSVRKSHSSYEEIQIKNISDELRKMVDYLDMRCKSEDIKDEWTDIGKVLDRLFFWMSTLLLAIVLPLLLLRVI